MAARHLFRAFQQNVKASSLITAFSNVHRLNKEVLRKPEHPAMKAQSYLVKHSPLLKRSNHLESQLSGFHNIFPKSSDNTCCRFSPPAWPWASRSAKSWAMAVTARVVSSRATILLAISLASLFPHRWLPLPGQEVRMSSSVGIFRSNNRWFQGNRSDCTASKASHANITRLSSCQSTKLSFRKFFFYV